MCVDSIYNLKNHLTKLKRECMLDLHKRFCKYHKLDVWKLSDINVNVMRRITFYFHLIELHVREKLKRHLLVLNMEL